MSNKKTNIPWGPIFALLVGIPTVAAFIYSRTPQITVKNELSSSIKIFANSEYRGAVGADSTRTFRFYSEADFPLSLSWQSIPREAPNGDLIGGYVTGSIAQVDNHMRVTITHTTGKNDYFMPVLNNNTDMTCRIVVNDGLRNEQYGGILLPHKQRVNAGYFNWVGNSNVTLYCDDGTHWWGDRNGKEGPQLKVQSPRGETDLTISP